MTAMEAVGEQLAKALAEDGWAPKRNALVVLSQCASDFPREIALVLRSALEALIEKESQKDIKLLASSLLTKLPLPPTPPTQPVVPETTAAPVVAEQPLDKPASDKPIDELKRKSLADTEEESAKRARANNDRRQDNQDRLQRRPNRDRDRPIPRR